MKPPSDIDATQSLLDVVKRDGGVLVTFGDGLTILFSGKRLRSCAFADHRESLAPIGQSEQPS